MQPCAAGGASKATREALLRFLAACYSATPRLAQTICETMEKSEPYTPMLLKTSFLDLIFPQFHAEGRRIAREERKHLFALIDEIEGRVGTGAARDKATVFKKHIGDSPWTWTPKQIWDGAKNYIAEQQPHIIDSTSYCSKKIHDLAFYQRMIDLAFWSGLYAERPEAFGV